MRVRWKESGLKSLGAGRRINVAAGDETDYPISQIGRYPAGAYEVVDESPDAKEPRPSGGETTTKAAAIEIEAAKVEMERNAVGRAEGDPYAMSPHEQAEYDALTGGEKRTFTIARNKRIKDELASEEAEDGEGDGSEE